MNKILRKGWAVLLTAGVAFAGIAGTISLAPSALAYTVNADPANKADWIIYDHSNVTSAAAWSNKGYNAQSPYQLEADGSLAGTLPATAGFAQAAALTATHSMPQHIWVNGNSNSAEILFQGYGQKGYTDFMLYNSRSSYKKSIEFSLDMKRIDTHTINGFGTFLNAGIENGTLKADVIYFKAVSNGSGNIYYKNISLNVNSMANTSNTLLSSAAAGGTLIGSYTRNASAALNKYHVKVDIVDEAITVQLAPYTSVNTVGNFTTLNNGQPVTSPGTGYYGFGIYTDYGGHACTSLSTMLYSDLKVAIVYVVNFNGNGGTFTDGSDKYRIVELDPGRSITAQGKGGEFPTNPTRPGYTFKGWVDESGKPFDANTTLVENGGSTEVKAVWEKNLQIVDGEHGTIVNGPIDIFGKQDGDKIGTDLDDRGSNVTPEDGWAFDHWVDDKGNVVDKDTVIKNETGNSLKPVMEKDANLDRIPDKYQFGHNITFQADTTRGQLKPGDTVSYDVYAGDNRNGSTAPGSYNEAVKNAPVVIPGTVPNDGYEFVGWAVAGSSSPTLYDDLDDLLRRHTFTGTGTVLVAQFKTQPPVATINANESGYTNTSVPLVSKGGSVAGMKEYEVTDAAGNTLAIGSYGGNSQKEVMDNLQAEYNGTYTITVKDIENAVVTDTVTVSTIDKTAPVINSSSTPAQGLAGLNPTPVDPAGTGLRINDAQSGINTGKTKYTLVDTSNGMTIEGADWNTVVSQARPNHSYEVYAYAEDNAGNPVDTTGSDKPSFGVQIPGGPYVNSGAGNNGGAAVAPKVTVIGGEAVLSRLMLNGMLNLMVDDTAGPTYDLYVESSRGTVSSQIAFAAANKRASIRLTTANGFDRGSNTIVLKDGQTEIYRKTFHIK